MSDDFKYKCRRRSGGRPASSAIKDPVLPGDPCFGAGSGGGFPKTASDGSHIQQLDGAGGMTANSLHFATRPALHPATGGPYVISLFSPGSGENGLIEMNASQGIRVTTGAPQLPPTSAANTKGVEIEVLETGEIDIVRGMERQQVVSLYNGGIDVVAKEGFINIASLERIRLQVGFSSIELSQQGITIDGLITYIN